MERRRLAGIHFLPWKTQKTRKIYWAIALSDESDGASLVHSILSIPSILSILVPVPCP